MKPNFSWCGSLYPLMWEGGAVRCPAIPNRRAQAALQDLMTKGTHAEDAHYFLKTIIPSRKATRDFLGMDDPDEKA